MVHNEVTPEHQTHLPALCLDRMGRAEEIADVAVFLSSEGASYITGATVNVDGGYTVM
jgi:3-oxoacyl-[acyl-carrier protein] reductase